LIKFGSQDKSITKLSNMNIHTIIIKVQNILNFLKECLDVCFALSVWFSIKAQHACLQLTSQTWKWLLGIKHFKFEFLKNLLIFHFVELMSTCWIRIIYVNHVTNEVKRNIKSNRVDIWVNDTENNEHFCSKAIL
jgi:hypothetical protein